MRDVPIIMSAPMVRALLVEAKEAGTGKQMTRRRAWRECRTCGGSGRLADGPNERVLCGDCGALGKLPTPWQRVASGDRLWVRENWRPVHSADPTRGAKYRADVGLDQTKWRPSIHMPRWASRLTIVLATVKTERVHDISEQDCEREGLYWRAGLWHCPAPDGGVWHSTKGHTDCFRLLWSKLHGEASWHANPEIVAMGGVVHACNIDALASGNVARATA